MSEQQGRIELVTLERSVQLTEQLGIPAILADRNIFRLLLRRPTLAKAVNELLYSLLYGAELDDRLRELVIMRIAWVSGRFAGGFFEAGNERLFQGFRTACTGQLGRRSLGQHPSGMHQRDSVAALSLVHEMG